MRLPVTDAILLGNQNRLILIGRDPTSCWVSSGFIASVNYGRQLVCDIYGCEFHAAWAVPDFNFSHLEFSFASQNECWERVFRHKADTWQRHCGWKPNERKGVLQANLWRVIAIGESLHIAGLLIGHPEIYDGWGMTGEISHLSPEACFAVTAQDQQRWHLGRRCGMETAHRIEELMEVARTQAPTSVDVYALENSDLSAFVDQPYVATL